jgi:hypothetical protein
LRKLSDEEENDGRIGFRGSFLMRKRIANGFAFGKLSDEEKNSERICFRGSFGRWSVRDFVGKETD